MNKTKSWSFEKVIGELLSAIRKTKTVENQKNGDTTTDNSKENHKNITNYMAQIRKLWEKIINS